MELLMVAIALAWAAGAQSEQAKLNVGPAERAALREKARHERAVQKIAEKHGVPVADVDLPGTFKSGYRSPAGRIGDLIRRHRKTTPDDAGRRAVEDYRDREVKAGRPDPAPLVAPDPNHVLVARPPATIPPPPAYPPTVGAATKPSTGPESPSKAKDGTSDPTAPEKPADGAAGAVPAPRSDAEAAKPAAAGPPDAATAPVTAEKPVTPPVTPPVTGGATAGATTAAPDATPTAPGATTAAPEGTGRAAAEVSYTSVAEESDELNLMCDDDLAVYEKVQNVCQREATKGDELVVQIRDAGFGERIAAWMVSCKEKYATLAAQLQELRGLTMAQSEGVWKAKGLLIAGQGVYADIAKDMESVATRDAYISDRVDDEDLAAHNETFEIRSAQ
ncbi:hypothetical protein ACTWJ8_40275 (plasmid) [Streptomyces sp. SDT5-1]|uniref:hypothetical protein n=1 Tax=Streptomyces sp. SDT5-1 TaxID=3406418 RepID=UPI003FD51B25